jgi:simple sugar transport system ATP-binding protein
VRLELRGITKRFGSLVANDHIDLTVEPGQIHALLGENGAGKTTLMNILYGLMHPDEGEIWVDGAKQVFGSPRDAIKAGIGMVHQHFMLVPVFTVAENVTLGLEPTERLRIGIGSWRLPPIPTGLLDRRRARQEVLELSRRYGMNVNPDAYVEDLPVGVQQRVEIIKTLLRDAQVLILDEPTAVLTPSETEDLIRVIRELRAGGRSIVFISHKLKEVQEIADTVTVIRHGRVVGERPPTAADTELAALMVGRQVLLRVNKAPAQPGGVVLDVTGLSVADDHGNPAVRDVSLQVRSGEILGIAGVQGNGQSELCEALMGLRPATAGSVHLDGTDVSHATPRERLRAGIGYVPEDRQEDGLVASFSIADNLILDQYNQPPYGSSIALKLDAIKTGAAARVAEFDVRTTSAQAPASSLSGGNQQKVILAREMSRQVRLLMASQPTRGLDVGSIEFVHQRLVDGRDHGTAVLIVSSELDEIYALADRIAVMYEGRIVGFRPPTVPVEELGLLMAGAGDGDGAGDGAAAGDGTGRAGPGADGQPDGSDPLSTPGRAEPSAGQT